MNEEKEVNRVHYRIARREANRAVSVAKNNAYDKLYERLESKVGEKEVSSWQGLGKDEQEI